MLRDDATAATVHLLIVPETSGEAPEDAVSELLGGITDWAYADGGHPRPCPIKQGYTEGDFLDTDPYAGARGDFAGSISLKPGEHITVHRPDMNARYRITARGSARSGNMVYDVLFICAEGHWAEGDTEPATSVLSLAEALLYAVTTKP